MIDGDSDSDDGASVEVMNLTATTLRDRACSLAALRRARKRNPALSLSLRPVVEVYIVVRSRNQVERIRDAG